MPELAVSCSGCQETYRIGADAAVVTSGGVGADFGATVSGGNTTATALLQIPQHVCVAIRGWWR